MGLVNAAYRAITFTRSAPESDRERTLHWIAGQNLPYLTQARSDEGLLFSGRPEDGKEVPPSISCSAEKASSNPVATLRTRLVDVVKRKLPQPERKALEKEIVTWEVALGFLLRRCFLRLRAASASKGQKGALSESSGRTLRARGKRGGVRCLLRASSGRPAAASGPASKGKTARREVSSLGFEWEAAAASGPTTARKGQEGQWQTAAGGRWFLLRADNRSSGSQLGDRWITGRNTAVALGTHGSAEFMNKNFQILSSTKLDLQDGIHPLGGSSSRQVKVFLLACHMPSLPQVLHSNHNGTLDS
ncbi:hypothetical protein Taro_006769 [Colocasia esculenta]|uniref:Uncharacterized protein n=1 Tax=Colocasia esculenta TaxID=4460 RepID=A0A843TW94_COLES|nr:hypothetical protein [Colocasia esculenta]